MESAHCLRHLRRHEYSRYLWQVLPAIPISGGCHGLSRGASCASASPDRIKRWQATASGHERYLRDDPWHELFAGLKNIGYEGFCLAELHPPSPDPERIMRYYEGLWGALTA